MNRIAYLFIPILFSPGAFAQVQESDTLKKNTAVTLKEVIVSANKTEETKRDVPQQVQVLTAADIANSQAQSTADLLSAQGGVFVQKSQQGGGSVGIRGFEASRNLLVIDGVRINNIIYRAGHLQNIITTDNTIFERAEILFGPSSTVYGSDALGGVVHMYTRNPILAGGEKRSAVKVNVLSRYGSVNREATNHVDVNLGFKKFGSLTSFTYSIFGDLMGGRNQNPFYNAPYGERTYYAERFNNRDSLVLNKNRYLQVGSAYTQYDVMQKFLFRPKEHISHVLNIQYSSSGDVPRYDRLTDPKGAGLASAEWYYGPQMRLLTAYDMDVKKPGGIFENVHLGLNYQSIEESRHNRNFGSRFRNHRVENVSVGGMNLDFQETMKSHRVRFGVDGQLNSLVSTAGREDIVADTTGKLDTRYPDGVNQMINAAAYVSHTWKINGELALTDGFRAGYSTMHSTLVDTALLFHLPYTVLDQKTPVYSGSIGVVHTPSEDVKLSLMVSTGFRVPNVDDMSKIFASVPGAVIVPNMNLGPERTVNYELGITKILNGRTRSENFVYYTDFIDAIVTDAATYNGQDSILYDGVMSRVYANQNKGRAYIYGISSNWITQLNERLSTSFMFNYTYGRVKTLGGDVPLDHIPPVMARLGITYRAGNFGSEVFANYNGWKRLKDYGGGEDNLQYATVDGMPAWMTLNLHFSYRVVKYVTLRAGIDNALDTQYRTFASGINAPGRNMFIALHGSF